MLQKFLLTSQPWQKTLVKTVAFAVTCVATFGFMLCITAFIIIRVDTPEYVLIPLTTALLTFASFLDSFLLAKSFKENGIIIGISTGAIFVAIVILLAVYNRTFAITSLLITKLTAIMLAGMLGGILGVNS